MLQQGEGVYFVQYPSLPVGSAIGHAANEDGGNLETRLAQADVMLNLGTCLGRHDCKYEIEMWQVINADGSEIRESGNLERLIKIE